MKRSINCYCLNVFLAALLAGLMLNVAAAQEPEKSPEAKKPKATERMPSDEGVGSLKPKDDKTLTDVDRQAGRREVESEAEAELQPYFNNYFKTLHFGPQDIVSVLVFNHEKYSMMNITVPPDGMARPLERLCGFHPRAAELIFRINQPCGHHQRRILTVRGRTGPRRGIQMPVVIRIAIRRVRVAVRIGQTGAGLLDERECHTGFRFLAFRLPLCFR